MKSNKAFGKDEISFDAIKLGGDELLKYITSLFNKFLKDGVIPNQWNEAKTILLHKKGCTTQLCNYRPMIIYKHI